MGQRWEDVLDVQLDLWRFWNKDPRAKALAGGYISAKSAAWADAPDTTPESVRAANRAVNSILARLPDTLHDAEPMWVDPDMMTLVESAAEQFQPEPLHPQDLISTNGFIYLPRPMYMKDIRGKTVSVRAYCWAPISLPVRLPEDAIRDGVNPADAMQSGIGVTLFSSWRDKDDYHHGPKPSMDLQLLHVTPWFFGHGYPTAGSGMTETARIIQTLWRVATQTITDRTHHEGSAPFRGRLAKANFPVRKVTVIRLRRPAYIPSGDHHDIEWTRRWIVRAHWRNQYYATLKIHRQILVPAYVKGPEDKPLVVTMRAFELVR